MDSQVYQRAKAIFFEACERGPDERGRYVDLACGDDATLRRAVLDLLAHDSDPLTFITDSPLREGLEQLIKSSAGGDGSTSAARGKGLPRPERIGGYRILDVLGQGGMGVVYLAEQDHPRRQVALKVIAPGQASTSMLRRFGHEVEILGRLHHPGIAQIYEAGTHDAGHGVQPFFAMELVRGRPLLAYCEHARCDTTIRLKLFSSICEAVHHAHQQGVVHRDLKPANIMVVDGPEDRVETKILDFGVARIIDSDSRATTMHTAADQILGTLPYMSPEQVSGQAHQVDWRSDVYSLGVILFELLSGRLPHDVTNKTMPETIRIIGQDDPATLSMVSRQFRGDLDTIVRKALDREKSRRYQSAGELAADVRRFLEHEPILARPPSTAYQLRKFARRNRALVGGVVAAFVVLVAGIITTAWQARQAIVARDAQVELRKQADRSALAASLEAEKALSVNTFLRRMLSSAQPELSHGREVSVREVLDAAALEINALAGSMAPEVEAMIQLSIGESYLAIGRVTEAAEHLDRALTLNRQRYGEPSKEVAQTLTALASVKNTHGDYTGAAALAQHALEMVQSLHAGDDPHVALLLGNLAEYAISQGERDRGIELRTASMHMWRRLKGAKSLEAAEAQIRIAGMHHAPRDAEPLVRDALKTMRETVGERHPSYVDAMRQLAAMLSMSRRYSEAVEAYNQTLALGDLVYGPEHPLQLLVLQDLGFCHSLNGQYGAALEICNRTVIMAESIYGEKSMKTADLYMVRGDILGALGNDRGMLDDHRKAIDMATRAGHTDDVRTSVTRLTMAAAMLRLRENLDEVKVLANDAFTATDRLPNNLQWIAGAAQSILGELAMLERDFERAETLMLRGYERLGESRLLLPHRQTAASRLVTLYEAWDKVDPTARKTEHANRWREVLAQLVPAPPAHTQPATAPAAASTRR